ncbi:MAG: H(+)/Cl(-) exchange transporter ClcA [Verrucomicrobia bacterium ADurb.Bin345]|nr:MAG: H(+)/Cl(-) exchange transporter ClcA [Verrucomicrobia bacterium ADurb.Bin345]
MHEHLFPLLVAILIGLLGGLAVVLFRLLISAFADLFWGSSLAFAGLLRGQPWWRIILVPAVGGLLVGVIAHLLSREASGHGVPEVMAAIALHNGIIRARVAVVKAVTAAITLASGGSAGPEGPVIQIGAAIGSATGQYLKISRRRLRTFIGCGAAAGIAATFNAPIAGALFSAEVILSEFGVGQFSPIVISSVLATLVSRQCFGTGPVFAVPHYQLAHALELIPYALLGVACAFVSASFIRLMGFSEQFFDERKRVPPWLRPALGGLAVGLIGVLVPHVLSDGHHVIDLALLNRLAWWMLPLLLGLKIVATSLSLGSGGSGGVFSPALFMGAMTGAFVGKIMGSILGDLPAEVGSYALAGMGGLVAGTTHAPITAILIIFEITGNYTVILPIMTVAIISTLLARKLCPQTIYTIKLARQGIDLFRGQSLDLLRHVPVQRCIRTAFETVAPGSPAHDTLQRLLRSPHTQIYLSEPGGPCTGLVTLTDARRALAGHSSLGRVLLVDDIARTDTPRCASDESLSTALPKFARSGLPELPVVDASGKLIGVIHYSDVIQIYQDEIFRADTTGRMAAHVAEAQRANKVRVMEGFYLAEWDPPSSLWGRSLKDIRLPSQYGIHVVLVKSTRGGADAEVLPVVPGPDYVVSENDALIVYGREADIDRVLTL